MVVALWEEICIRGGRVAVLLFICFDTLGGLLAVYLEIHFLTKSVDLTSELHRDT